MVVNDDQHESGDIFVLNVNCRFDSCDPTTIIESDDAIFTFQGVDPETLVRVLTRLDGTSGVREIASAIGVSSGTVFDICRTLLRHGLATRIQETDGGDISKEF